jgi:hypothetical protein
MHNSKHIILENIYQLYILLRSRDIHPNLLGSSQDVLGGVAFPPPAPDESHPTASTTPAPSMAVVLVSGPLPAPDMLPPINF